jgi:hypothetical protein
MIRRSQSLIIAGLLTAFLAAGCFHSEPPATRISFEELLLERNAVAARVPRLWARAKIAITIKDPDTSLPMTWGSTSRLASPNGLLLLFKGEDPLEPEDFVLIGREMAGLELFRIGLSKEEGAYYFWHNFGEQRGAYWGEIDRAGMASVGALTIDPRDLLAVLDISHLPTDMAMLPLVALTMDETSDGYAYVLHRLDRTGVGQRVGLRRQTFIRWDDDDPREAFLTKFFDRQGNVIMTAEQSDYEPISAVEGAMPALMPTDILITWPETGTRMHLVLSEMTAEDRADPAVCRFRDHLPASISDAQIIQIDAPRSNPPSDE